MWRIVPAASGFSNHGVIWSFRSTSGIRWWTSFMEPFADVVKMQ